jgi:hypothetical protein
MPLVDADHVRKGPSDIDRNAHPTPSCSDRIRRTVSREQGNARSPLRRSLDCMQLVTIVKRNHHVDAKKLYLLSANDKF